MNKNNLGEYISSLRNEVKISNRELSRNADISQTYMNNIEKGKQKKPTKDVLNKIALGFSKYGLDKDTILFELLNRTPGFEDDELKKNVLKSYNVSNFYSHISLDDKGQLMKTKPNPQDSMIDLSDILNAKNQIETKHTFKILDHEHTVVLGKNIKQQILNVVDELVKMHVYNNPELLNSDEADNENVDWKISTNKLRIIEQQDVKKEDGDN
ncbi:helix-turn-helix domain-containing protein [Mammaliicoccus sciuri]|uniref:helix-turn-helix domain-containing protein n=1 Tax=Mammaliicoccus sciuri TaxID=1296 RepID=UPI0034DD89FE